MTQLFNRSGTPRMIYVTIETLKGGRRTLRAAPDGRRAFSSHSTAVRNSERWRGWGNTVATHSFVDIPAAEAFVAAHNATIVTARARAKEYA
jgi:hypothetical protein